MTKYYFTVEEVMEITGYARSKSYNIIKEMNEELEREGFKVSPGRIPIKFFEKKFFGFQYTS